MAETDYTLMEPFDIDNRELDGIRPQIVFCLGYEWCQLKALLETGEAVIKTVHTENVSRIKRMCIRRGRKFKIDPCSDAADEWHFLEVEAA